LTDRSVTVGRESSAALGQGFRLGFLGSLHNDVFRQRLEDEHGAEIIITRPFVPIKGELFTSCLRPARGPGIDELGFWFGLGKW
jgi:translation elongation factor EF-4